MNEDCELCTAPGGRVLFEDGFCRVVRPDDLDYPATVRVVLGRHARELSDLAPAERWRLMRAVFAAEEAIRGVLAPAKMNVASLGNLVPHVHWHLVPRRRDDRHFPAPVWGEPRRAAAPGWTAADLERLDAALAARLATEFRGDAHDQGGATR